MVGLELLRTKEGVAFDTDSVGPGTADVPQLVIYVTVVVYVPTGTVILVVPLPIIRVPPVEKPAGFDVIV